MSLLASARFVYSPLPKDRAHFVETAAESGGGRTLLEIELEPRAATHRTAT